MAMRALKWQVPLALALAATGVQSASAAGFLALSKTNKAVLQACNTTNSSSDTTCRVTSLPGEDGYELTASRSTPIVINDITVGTYTEKVWQNIADKALYIFGSRVVLNNSTWDDSLVPFRVNDLFRRTLPDNSVAAAYYQNGAATSLKLAGRAFQGLGEYDGSQPDRDNTWVDGRIDANGAGSAAEKKSPWVLTKTKAGSGVTSNSFGVRLINSYATYSTEIFLNGYEAAGIPVSDGGDD